MPNHATNFYKSLLGHDDNIGLSLDMKFWENHDKVGEEENMFLDAPFTEDETRTTIFYSYAKGAPGPNGFSFLFYQKMDLIKKDLMGVVKQFEVGALNIERLNYFIITLIPKSKKLLILRNLGQLVC